MLSEPLAGKTKEKKEMSFRILRCFMSLLVTGVMLPVLVSGQEPERGFEPPQQFGAGGGPYFSTIQLSIPDLDSRFTGMGLEGIPEWVTLYGSGGGINVGPFFIGGFALEGSVEHSSTSAGIVREARVDLSRSGVALGYVKAVGRMKLTLGSTIGGGRLTTRLRRRPDTAVSWEDLWTYYRDDFSGTVDSSDLNISTVIEGKYLLFEPYLSIRYWVIPLVSVDIGATYHFGSIRSGKLKENGQTLSGSPEISLSGVGFRIGIFFGF